jgi:beta-galactosidase/beta-glucuronidase
MHKILLLIGSICCCVNTIAQQTIIKYLSGKDKDHTVEWDFMVTTGRNSGKWSKIAVPSCWEQQGFGTYNYFEDLQNPGEEGYYKHRFRTDKAWANEKVFIVFEGAMTDAEVKIYGMPAGPVHQGAFYAFRYDISELLKGQTEHLLEVNVRKKSANASINRAERQADFWLFGGLFRPVYLEVVPQTFIERVAIDAKAEGAFNIQVFTNGIAKNQVVEVQVQALNGKAIGNPFRVAAADSNYLSQNFTGVQAWNPEHPNLYKAVVSIKEGSKTVHSITKRFGFRTVTFRQQDGFYVNGTKAVFKGVCRHSHWPESGRTLSRQVHLLDIGLIKKMNMNAVRMSHYPPDSEFLDLCDSLGLFVIDELTGWQKAYDTTTAGRLVKEMLARDVNHPSIVMWANGNEGGWNRAVDGDYHWYDPQKRLVIHPWERFNGTDTKHYPDFNYVANAALYGTEVFFPTEFMHGLFDGGHGAGLDDFWNEMRKHRSFSGGFLWALHDEGAVRTDKEGLIDVAGNAAPDGIVGPHREREGSFYAIREIWSPVYIDVKSLAKPFDGRIAVENRYHNTNLSQCRFQWQVVAFSDSSGGKEIKNGMVRAPDIAPGEKGFLHIPIPANTKGDALYLTAFTAKGDTICTWSWALVTPAETAARTIVEKTEDITTKQEKNRFTVTCDGISYRFDTTTGFLASVFSNGKEIALRGGPALGGDTLALGRFHYYKEGDRLIVTPFYTSHPFTATWTFAPGQLPKLEYSYSKKGSVDFMGITFDYPEEKITGMKWMGRGPYRVWKNRLRGQQFGVWEKGYNNTVTGESWNYPEFKGWHAELYWVTLQTKESDFTIFTDHKAIFLQMLKPEKPKGAKNENTSPPFPEGNIGFMHAISAIGTKFQPAEVMGPQSGKNTQLNYTPVSGALYFDFR